MRLNLRYFCSRIALVSFAFGTTSPVTAATYCTGMAELAEISAKMRDSGLSEKKTLHELRKMSPKREVNRDVADLVHAAYMDTGRSMSPVEFRTFFESFCRNGGFDRAL